MGNSKALVKAEPMDIVTTNSNYQFSAVRADNLGASEYTLATIVCDRSSSVAGFQKELEAALKTALEACQKSPRSDNLMLRLTKFNEGVDEVHGFRLLNTIDPKEYDGAIDCSGYTALFDATFMGIEATIEYARILYGQDYLTNAIVFVLTDGDDNRSTETPARIKKLVDKIRKDEAIESIHIVLVGVNTKEAGIRDYLERFQKEADITQYVDIESATPKMLAKLAKFISSSISSTSQALGTGAASQPLTF